MSDPEKNDRYDLCVIGCGPSGFAAAMRAFDMGKHVVIIEKDEIGGAGVKWGALASKTMWELSNDYYIAAKTDRGYRASALHPDYGSVMDTVQRAVKEKQYQMISQIETFSRRRWKGPGSLTLKRGCGAFRSPDSLDILTDGKVDETVVADFFLIASGSKPKEFPGIPFDHKRILSSDSILSLKSFPKRLIIIGAGIVGCEYATIFSNYNRTKVYLVDHAESVIPYEDFDISRFVSSCLENNGVEIFHSAALKDIVKRKDHLDITLDFEDGHSQVVEVDAALISIGREPNLSCLNLQHAGILPDKTGRIVTDDNCMAGRHIYAAGDVTHLPALVNIAEMEGRHAVASMFGKPSKPLSYKDMSTIMFFHPAVAAVGMSEKSCRKKNIPYRAAYYSNAFLPRAIAMRALNGFFKIIATDEDNPKILGMRAAGPQVSGTVMAVSLAMKRSECVSDMLESLYPHPTMSEAMQECMRMLIGTSTFKPFAFPGRLRTWSWHPGKEKDEEIKQSSIETNGGKE
ncbi:MAG: NAD(P)/FAD-dependent oxidoreductase [Proteobacteria bacterium]|nr:NAD(P)/FAD-dependent oxidoreductase [Pseudomonadota bacterium]